MIGYDMTILEKGSDTGSKDPMRPVTRFLILALVVVR